MAENTIPPELSQQPVIDNSIAADASQPPQPPPQPTATREVKRRNRRPVVCKPCRERRSKCSRDKPCSICAKRGESHLCVYAEPIDKSGSQAASRHAKAAASRAKQIEKLSQLEDLFKRILQGNHASISAISDGKAQPYSYDGQSSVNQGDALDPSMVPHWSSLFNELRSSMEGYEDRFSDGDEGIITSEEKPVLLGAFPPPPLQTIIDRRINLYFSSTYMVIPVIHSGKFLNEYEDFWQTPADAVDPIWTALLFAILSLSAYMSSVSGGGELDITCHENWIMACSHCLTLGGYSKPRPYLIPALLMMAQSQYQRYLDPSREVSLILSIVVRLAYQSGLHREPGSAMSVFDTEMRRRLWVMIRHFDTQVACQFGVPSTLQDGVADIQAPRNLADTDMHESMTELPPARPDNELSSLNSFVTKNKLMIIFAKIYSHALSATPGNDDDARVRSLDLEINQAYSQVPTVFKPKPISLSLGDADHLRMFRITLDFLFRKSLIILHRKGLTRSVERSRTTCLAAANQILVTFAELISELRPGKLMEGKAWMLSVTTVNDYLLACMTMSVAMATDRALIKSSIFDEHLSKLETARSICLELAPKSRGAVKVASAISSVLLRHGHGIPVSQSIPPEGPMDPRLAQSPSTTSASLASTNTNVNAYQPAPSYNLNNGFPLPPTPKSSAAQPTQPTTTFSFPSPAPSSALSQERSTSLVPTTMPSTAPYFAGQPMLAGILPATNQAEAAAASAATSSQPQQQGQFFAQQSAQTQTQGQFPALEYTTPIQNPFERLGIGAGTNGADDGMTTAEDIDWTVFDAYITEF
jgi:hypothetical protein